MYSDAEPIASPFVDWDARRKAVPCRANHKMLSLAAVPHVTQPSQNECQLATLENPSRLQRGRSRQTVFHIPTDPGVGAVDPKLARLVEQGEKANMSPWVMVEMGYEMGYSPKDVMEALSNDSRAKMGLPPKPVGEGPVIHVFKKRARPRKLTMAVSTQATRLALQRARYPCSSGRARLTSSTNGKKAHRCHQWAMHQPRRTSPPWRRSTWQ